MIAPDVSGQLLRRPASANGKGRVGPTTPEATASDRSFRTLYRQARDLPEGECTKEPVEHSTRPQRKSPVNGVIPAPAVCLAATRAHDGAPFTNPW